MSNQDDHVTYADLKTMKNEIVDEISAVLGDAMTSIGFSLKQIDNKFEQLDNRVEQIDNRVEQISKDVETLKDSQYRIEQKLDPTVSRLDDHSVRIARLEQISA